MTSSLAGAVRALFLLVHALVAAAFLAAATPAAASETAIVTGFEWSGDGGTLAIAVEGEPESEIILLQNPYRLAIDLADTVTAVRPAAPDEGPVAAIRDGLTAQDRYRLLFQLDEPVIPAFTTETEDGRTTLRIESEPATPEAYAAAVAERAGQTVRAEASGVRPAEAQRTTVVIDAGHGGADYGAVGAGGTLEKELNLSFARKLREALAAAHPGIEIVLARDEDILIPLAERSAMARRAGADLFVSIHADSIRHRDLRGATVYTLSLNASDQLASEVAESENAADRFAGPEWTQDTPEIHDILVDLVKRETEGLSRRFADELILELRAADVRLINNPKRSAGFRVLMAPDVPSVLLEMGYLSNGEDEALMMKPEWQDETAGVVATAIGSFLGVETAER